MMPRRNIDSTQYYDCSSSLDYLDVRPDQPRSWIALNHQHRTSTVLPFLKQILFVKHHQLPVPRAHTLTPNHFATHWHNKAQVTQSPYSRLQSVQPRSRPWRRHTHVSELNS